MHEQSKAAERRRKDWHYTHQYFVGAGIDVGAGPDGLSKLRRFYPLITSVRDWDMEDGDAIDLEGIAPESLDFVSASHVLEHLDLPTGAVDRWLRVLKRGGHLIVTVPDSMMYERGQWPSRFGVGHIWRFTTDPRNVGDGMRHVPAFLGNFRDESSIERLTVLREHFDPTLGLEVDQTMGPAECAIEFVLRKL